MAWMLAVLALVLVWWYLRQRRPPPVEPKPLPDPRELLAVELEQAAKAAREEGRHQDAQLSALRSAWLKTSPKLGDDTPPTELDPDDPRHLRLAGDLWAEYRTILGQPDPGPASPLPYPEQSIARALDMLIAIGEGRVRSIHVDPDQVSQDVLDEMRRARDQLQKGAGSAENGGGQV